MSACVISFSSRKNGNCSVVAELIRTLLPGAALYSFCDIDLCPCGRCGYECLSGGLCPLSDGENKLLEAVTDSDATFFVIPNYCDYPCANFFIFNERSNGFFQGREEILEKYLGVPKKAVVVSGTGTDGSNFKRALSYHADGELPILFLSAGDHSGGKILTSPETVREIERFVRG